MHWNSQTEYLALKTIFSKSLFDITVRKIRQKTFPIISVYENSQQLATWLCPQNECLGVFSHHWTNNVTDTQNLAHKAFVHKEYLLPWDLFIYITFLEASTQKTAEQQNLSDLEHKTTSLNQTKCKIHKVNCS